LADLRRIIKERLEEYLNQFLEKKIVYFRTKELAFTDQTFNLFYLVILGEDLFREFMREFNQSVEILRKFQKELKEETPVQENNP